jgi:mannose-6-phosphate isomerase-like protein (cupin superfamily)
MKIEKIWGTTEPLVMTPMFELHRLRILPDMRCSFHVHRFKWNAFYVIEGLVFIDTVENELATVISVELASGDFTTIAPGLHHQFRTGPGPCLMLEAYYTEPLSEDIIRRNVGGPA